MASYKPVKLAYKLFEPKCGSDNGLSPLIFTHGFGYPSDVTWEDLPQTFADQTKRKAYALDARNHGDSEWSDEFDFDLNMEDLLHFIDEMSFPKAILICHCMGGITGIKAAIREPERIEMLLIEDMYIKKVPQSLANSGIMFMGKWRETEKFIPPGIDKNYAENFIRKFFLSSLDPKTDPFQNSLFSNDIPYPLGKDSSGRYVFKVNLEVILEKLKNIDAMMTDIEGIYAGPSCFLYANDSPFQVGNEKHHILQHFPKAVIVPFETNSHFIHKEFPDLFVETVVSFIKQNEKHQ